MGNIIHGVHILQTQACSLSWRNHLRSRVGSRSRMLGSSARNSRRRQRVRRMQFATIIR
jgi:hypothetical protein